MENNFYYIIYYNLLISYNITINNDYNFIYDDFLEHLISDTEILVEKNYRAKKTNNSISINDLNFTNRIDYSKVVFKDCFYRHFANSEWGNKLIHPENYPELKRKLRINKLKRILNNGSM